MDSLKDMRRGPSQQGLPEGEGRLVQGDGVSLNVLPLGDTARRGAEHLKEGPDLPDQGVDGSDPWRGASRCTRPALLRTVMARADAGDCRPGSVAAGVLNDRLRAGIPSHPGKFVG